MRFYFVLAILSFCTNAFCAERDSSPEAFSPFLGETENKIFYYASLAPSGHNAQPWGVRVMPDGRWIVHIPPARRLPAVDPTGRETLLSVGAFIENLSLAAGAFGYRADYKVIASSGAASDIISLKLVAAPVVEYPLELIENRRVVRSDLTSSPLADGDVAILKSFAPESVCYYSMTSDEGQLISSVTVRANKAQAARDSAMKELGQWMRWNPSDIQKHRDGLTAKALGLSFFTRLYAGMFFDEGTSLKQGFREASVEVAEQLSDEGAGWLVITSTASDAPALVGTGRIFERISLAAQKSSLAFHPMTQAIEEGFEPELSRAINCPGRIQFLLRAGYVDSYPEPVSPRLRVKDFVTKGK